MNQGIELDQTTEVTDDVEYIYNLYPTKCPNRGTSTGKGAKDRVKIKSLLKKKGRSELERIIKRYIDECTASNCYLKNFSTFLNNLPEYEEEEETKTNKTIFGYQ